MSTTLETTLDSARADVPLTRLIGVELRKSVDTLAGRWMLVVIAAFTILVNVLIALGASAMHVGAVNLSFLLYWQNKVAFLVPVLAILLATSEWSQRTAMVTFTLVPDRWKTVVAKIVVAFVLGTAAFALSLIIGGLITIAGGNWNLGGVELLQRYITQMIGLSQGLGLGFLFLNSAAAIGTYFGIRILSILALTPILIFASIKSDFMHSLSPWIDLNLATAVTYHADGWLTGAQWGHLATATALWVGVPLTIGIWRVLHAEVK